MWYQGQRVRCTNDHFSGAVWEWTSALPKAGETYTIAALNRLPQWNTRTPILCFLLREMERETDHAFFSALECVGNDPRQQQNVVSAASFLSEASLKDSNPSSMLTLFGCDFSSVMIYCRPKMT